MVLFLAALQTVPRDLLDAVRVDGASRWQSFRAITLPLIAPFTLMVTILLTIASFKTFALIQLMTRGGPGSRHDRARPTTSISRVCSCSRWATRARSRSCCSWRS